MDREEIIQEVKSMASAFRRLEETNRRLTKHHGKSGNGRLETLHSIKESQMRLAAEVVEDLLDKMGGADESAADTALEEHIRQGVEEHDIRIIWNENDHPVLGVS